MDMNMIICFFFLIFSFEYKNFDYKILRQRAHCNHRFFFLKYKWQRQQQQRQQFFRHPVTVIFLEEVVDWDRVERIIP
jgi:hypothetical protein